MTGILTGGTYEQLSEAILRQTVFGEERGILRHGYTNNSYPTNFGEEDVLTVSCYDNYEWLQGSQYAFSTADALGVNYSMDVVSLSTGSKTNIIGYGINIDRWLTSVVYYDEKYNAIQTISDLYPSGKEIVSHKHDWTGRVIQTKVKQTSNAGTYEYNKWFDYDGYGRLTRVRQRITGDPNGEIIMASYEYDDMGRMTSKIVHNGTDTTKYEYSMMGAQIASQSGAFSYKLGFDRDIMNGAPIRHDGNISQVAWTDHQGEASAYIFGYDKSGQMTSANLFEKNQQNWIAVDKFAEKGISYDDNGNILSLIRTDNQG